MKKLLFILFAITALYSCDDEAEITPVNPQLNGIQFDASSITGIELEGRYKGQVCDATAVSSMSECLFEISFKGSHGYLQKDEKLNNALQNYYNERTAFIQEGYYNANSEYLWPLYFTGYIDGEVKIECDKPLFGQAAGENLTKYFNILTDMGEYYCMAYGRNNPKLLYSFTDSLPERMDQYCVKDSWLQYHYQFIANQEPSEKYDEITLTLSFPVTREYITDYVKAQLNGTPTDMKVVNEVLTASCKIHFL